MTYPDRQTATRMAECDERYRRVTGMGMVAYSRHTFRRIRALHEVADTSTRRREGAFGPSTGYGWAAWVDAWRRYESIRAAADSITGYRMPR